MISKSYHTDITLVASRAIHAESAPSPSLYARGARTDE